MLEKFLSGPKVLIAKLNKMVRVLNAVSNLRGDGIIKVQQSSSGYTVGISVDQLNARIPKTTGGAGLSNAFCAENAPNGNIVNAKLASDWVEGETIEDDSNIDIVCEIASATGDGDLFDAIPRLEEHTRLTVWKDGIVWRCTTLFQAIDDCPVEP